MIGRIEEIIINVTGYEAILKMDYDQLGKIFSSVMLAHEYDPTKNYEVIEAYREGNPAMKLKVGDTINSSLKIVYGNGVKSIESSSLGYIQNIERSPHALFTCTVLEVTEDETLKCDLGSILSDIEVEFEDSKEKVEQGDIINFSGEFTLSVI